MHGASAVAHCRMVRCGHSHAAAAALAAATPRHLASLLALPGSVAASGNVLLLLVLPHSLAQ
jgi:hypothetical protein